jgi:exosortase C (VPDSG-CTERM-specific)
VITAFCYPLFQLFRFALHTDLYSHIILIPLVSGYFVWLKRQELPIAGRPMGQWAVVPALGASAALFCLAVMNDLGTEDRLSLWALAFVFSVLAVCTFAFSAASLRILAFPLGFLIFMAPMPTWLIEGIETFLQHGSASAAFVMLSAAGTPVFREELLFQLPGITLQVAPECSGIRSTLALLITSIVAGYLFLRSPWKRTLLALLVVPLALLRNGFRIFTIGELCVHISPDMIDSYIHRQGGPIFFGLSLIPFSLVLWWLIHSERRRNDTPGSTGS